MRDVAKANGADLETCRGVLDDVYARSLNAGLERKPGRCGILDCAEVERLMKGLQFCLQGMSRIGAKLGGPP